MNQPNSASRFFSYLRRAMVCAIVVQSLPVGFLSAQSEKNYDYHMTTDMLVNYGRQALMMCNGLFVSNRTLEQIYEQELKLYRMPVLPPALVRIDEELKAVEVGGGGNNPFPVMRAVYREGLGAVLLAPNQTLANINELPALEIEKSADNASQISWPDGDKIQEKEVPDEVDKSALEAAARWAFNREEHGGHVSQVTISLLVVHKGEIIYERYAPGFDYTTRTRTWSTAKSIASTLIGALVGEGKLNLDDPLPYSWSPSTNETEKNQDPRSSITLRHVLHMSSGLYPVDNDKCHVVGSCLSYWAGASAVHGALDRGLVRQPGMHWDYENYDTILAVYAMKSVMSDQKAYLEFPYRALFEKIGMRNTLPGVDRFGDYIMSSQIYTNARDLTRLGLLYLNNGMWNGEQIIPESWVTFVRTPAPSTLKNGAFYGGQWWLVPNERNDVPQDTYYTAGHRGQYTIVVPSYDLVIVRRGLDWLPRKHRFAPIDLTHEVIKAFPKRPWGKKPSAFTK